MSTSTQSVAATRADGSTDIRGSRSRGPRAFLTAIGLLLVSAGWLLPVWQASLLAPQYPGGLTMYAYGHKVTGDVEEIDVLNHYVGMRPFRPEDFPEMRLWPLALIAAALAVVVALWVKRPLARGIARTYLWGMPLGVLAVIQFRLHQFGHDLDPVAALRLEPFTPWVVGPTKVWNFTTWARPGLAIAALLLAAAVVTFGPRLVARLAAQRGAAVLCLTVLLVVGLMAPAAAAEHDHGSHDGHGGSPVVVPDGPVSGEPPRQIADHAPAGDLAELLADARPGDEIRVPAGTYRGPVTIDVPVTLVGDGLPVIEGDGTGTVVTVAAPGTQLRGLAVRGSGPGPTGNPAAVLVKADDVTIESVVVEDSYVGIAVTGAERVRLIDNVVRGRADAAIAAEGHAVSDDGHAPDHSTHADGANATRGRGDGIWLHDAVQVLIRGNTVEDVRDGIYVSFGVDVLVDSNHVHGSRYAVHSMYAEHLTLAENHFQRNLSGAVLMYGGEVLLLRNRMEDNRSAATGFGVLLKDVVGARIVENVLVHNRVGVHLDGPTGAKDGAALTANTVARNQVGVSAYSSARGVFKANSFADNLVQVLPQGGKIDGLLWVDEGWGNYWSTYRGYEVEGRGGTPHVEGGVVDRVLVQAPELLAIADAPGLRLLRAVEERWSRRAPVLTDVAPLTRPASPAVASLRPADPVVVAAGAGIGALLLLPIVWLRRPRRRRVTDSRRNHGAIPA